jgi:hypothetical protein
VYAIATKHLTHPAISPSYLTQLGIEYANKAHQLISVEMGSPTTDSIVAMLMMTLYALICGKGTM